MRPELEQELSHVLLTELLSYQFASPVRWIETQDVFLRQRKTERVVEIGPSPTLSGMALKTIKAKYESYDAALSLHRQVLCYSKDAKKIYYTLDPYDVKDTSNVVKPILIDPIKKSDAVLVDPFNVVQSVKKANSNLKDTPVSAKFLLHTLIATKLKKSINAISMTKNIKDLVNGKSTVQNEIIGDLIKEFGSVPEKAEEIPLDELSVILQDSFDGQLGKTSTSLIGRLISSKMPGGYSITVARNYLQKTYSFESGRQDFVLLLSLTNEPLKRFENEAEANNFFDLTVHKYAEMEGITLNLNADNDTTNSNVSVINSADFVDFVNKNEKLAKHQLELLARYLKVDLNADRKLSIKQKSVLDTLQSKLDSWESELGEVYHDGITSKFSSIKARTFDSYWNWARQDVLLMYYDIIFGKLSSIDRETINQCIQIMNRSNSSLIKFMQYHIDHCQELKGETYSLAKNLGQQLIDNCKQVLNVDPVYKDVTRLTSPKTTIDCKGKIVYQEICKESIRRFEDYVYEMAQGNKLTQKSKCSHDELIKFCKKFIKNNNCVNNFEFEKLINQMISLVDLKSHTEDLHDLNFKKKFESNIMNKNDESFTSSDDEIASLTDKTSIIKPVFSTINSDTLPFLNIKRKTGNGWEYDSQYSAVYLNDLESMSINGITFKNKNVLLTGAGIDSIGVEVLRGLISGGAKVIVTTSRYSTEVIEYYQKLYSRYGSTDSILTVVPFNQGSKQDVDLLIDYIYEDVKKGGLGWDLDVLIPFAAIPVNGNGIDNIDSKSELGFRIMLTNVFRLLGAIKSKKKTDTRPAHCILPLSPNHGTFGFDGLYSEAKISLETLFNRWFSEDWSTKLTICGAVIGWTRGTGLMSNNNIIAEGIEKLGVRTFSQKEMAFNILGLLTPNFIRLCQDEPVMADLNGGLQFVENFKSYISSLRSDLMETSDIRRTISIETSLDEQVINGKNTDTNNDENFVKPKCNMKFEFPVLKPYSEIEKIAPDLKGMLDLESVIVVTGFSEVGPWGNSRTRWEMEAFGEFSLEGTIEMAWIMGLIKYHNGSLKGKPYVGWIDSKTNSPVDDKDIKSIYEERILQHSGIRLIEPELFHGYDPNKKQFIQEIIIQHDLEPFETSKENALNFKHEHNDKCEIIKQPDSDEYSVKLLKGAVLFVPKAIKFDRLVAGQIPTGWNAYTYGLTDEIINQVDPITLYVLVSTVEALISAGITDPYEFYKYIHVSELGNCSGSGMGGVSALRGMFKDRYTDKHVQNDILQESFINTMSAWVNLLLLSSSGPIKTPVGACATAVESVDIGVETIKLGKAKVCIVGGYDDFQEEGSYEFANMNATSNSLKEFELGRTPKEMSRPSTTTRSGFMESQGSGIQIIMSADLAIKMGVPIYGIIALTATASDKIGRSIPAPGKGILTTAKEYHSDNKFPNRILDLKYRSEQLKKRLQQIKEWKEQEFNDLILNTEIMKAQHGKDFNVQDFINESTKQIEIEFMSQCTCAKRQLGNNFYKSNPTIAPIRGALATFNLTIDDLGVASFHGTSTVANDKNESFTINEMLKHLGRSEGNPVFGVFQKYLTGHPKGAAGAWMLNGALQILNTGIVPGNRNADNVDVELQKFDYVLYPSRMIKTDGVKAVSVTSFGFGQKGAQAILVHPDYLYAVLEKTEYESYMTKVSARNKKAYRYMHNAITHCSLVEIKEKPPYDNDLEISVYLNPLARVENQENSYGFNQKSLEGNDQYLSSISNLTAEMLLNLNNSSKGVGVDVELLSSLNIENTDFIERNFTADEIQYCNNSSFPLASYTGTWSAKEAVFKSLSIESDGAASPLIDIEITHDQNGAPHVVLHGSAKEKSFCAGVKKVSVSISHDDYQATAVALSQY